MEKKKFVATQEQIDKLLAKIKELGISTPKRQHGRKGQTMENAEDELTRQYHNLQSIIYRAKKKAIYHQPSVQDSVDKVLQDAGISQTDVRRFKQCFVWEDSLHCYPDIAYIRLMTGLNDYQILVLEEYTKMKVMHKSEANW